MHELQRRDHLARERHTAHPRILSIMEVRLGVSACLAGQLVRWDGGHKRDELVTGALSEHLELIPLCPEVELGLGVPRPPINLVDRGGRLALEGAGADHTEPMQKLARRRAAELIEARVSGCVLKSRSPSCGLRDVPVIRGGERIEAGERGLFAATLAAEIAGLPLEDERGLADRQRRLSFFTRVFAWARLSAIVGHDLGRAWRRGELVEFHGREKLSLMAHSPEHYRRLGALVARVAELDPRELASRYRSELMAALEIPPSTGRHVNALQHAAGYLEGAERRAAIEAIDAFAAGELELDAARVWLLGAAARGGHGYLTEQTYLAPDPIEAALRR